MYTTIVIEPRCSLGPRDVDRLLGGIGRTLLTIAGNVPILVVAPWLSPRTRELPVTERVNYLDLTGNSYIRLDSPGLYITTQGANKNPSPLHPGRARVQGPKAGRLVRTLLDVSPPYGVRELASATGLAQSYVSRLLQALDDEALIERSERGRVTDVEIARLVRRWAEHYDIFRSNKVPRYLAPPGAAAVVSRLPSLKSRVAVTGSFAAVRLAPVAAPALLATYVDESHDDVARFLEFIPADAGANVALLAPSQVAVDCFTGSGRIPSEGEAVLDWLNTHEAKWRLSSLPAQKQARA